jgi:hypothetical protein
VSTMTCALRRLWTPGSHCGRGGHPARWSSLAWSCVDARLRSHFAAPSADADKSESHPKQQPPRRAGERFASSWPQPTSPRGLFWASSLDGGGRALTDLTRGSATLSRRIHSARDVRDLGRRVGREQLMLCDVRLSLHCGWWSARSLRPRPRRPDRRSPALPACSSRRPAALSPSAASVSRKCASVAVLSSAPVPPTPVRAVPDAAPRSRGRFGFRLSAHSQTAFKAIRSRSANSAQRAATSSPGTTSFLRVHDGRLRSHAKLWATARSARAMSRQRLAGSSPSARLKDQCPRGAGDASAAPPRRTPEQQWDLDCKCLKRPVIRPV